MPVWLREDADEAMHPKVLAMIDAAGYEAYYRLHRLRQWCAGLRTGGAFSEAAIREVGAKPRHIEAMLGARLIERGENGGYRIHDFDAYNPSKSGADRQRRYRERKRDA